MNIVVLGATPVGMCLAGLFAASGHQVRVVDRRVDDQNVDLFNWGEPELDRLLEKSVTSGRLTAERSCSAIPDGSFVLACVDVLSGISELRAALEQMVKALGGNRCTFVQTAAVKDGIGCLIQETFDRAGARAAYVSWPCLAWPWQMVKDMLDPRLVIAGSDNEAAAQAVLALFRSIEAARDQLATVAGIESIDAPAVTYKSMGAAAAESLMTLFDRIRGMYESASILRAESDPAELKITVNVDVTPGYPNDDLAECVRILSDMARGRLKRDAAPHDAALSLV